MEVKSFTCKELSQYTDSMLFDSGEVVAKATLCNGTEEIKIKLCVNGEVRVKFNDEIFFRASEFPEELTELFKNGKADDDERVEICSNNWFEYMWGDDYELEEMDLAVSSPADVLSNMVYFCSCE